MFYKGRAPHGQKTDWIMHEYRLEEANDPQGSANVSLSFSLTLTELYIYISFNTNKKVSAHNHFLMIHACLNVFVGRWVGGVQSVQEEEFIQDWK